MNTFFTSDTHFGHARQVPYRNCESVEEMDEALICKWNGVVSWNDTVYHLGDFSFHNPKKTRELAKRLKGRIYLVPGNHDSNTTLNALRECDVKILPPLTKLKVAENLPGGTANVHRFVLCHFPLLTWDGAQKGTIHLHGHSHGNCIYPNPLARILDVGVDAPASRGGLMSFEAVLAMMTALDRKHVAFDHH